MWVALTYKYASLENKDNQLASSTMASTRALAFFFIFILSYASDMSIITYDSHNMTLSPGRSEDEVVALFESWLAEHGKVYNAIDEKERRFNIFKSNLKFIDEHNSVEGSYKVGLNQFADIANEEFRAMYLSQETRFRNRKLRERPPATKGLRRATNSVDWREKGAVGPIRDQGICAFGSWAFAAVAAVESAYQIKTGNLTRLSVQELLDCDRNNQGCFGGSSMQAYEFMMDNDGITTERNYPYRGIPGFCKKSKKAVSIDGYDVLASDERGLMAGVADQPASVVIDAGSISFQFYQSGIFDGDCGSLYKQSVAVVGYEAAEDDFGVEVAPLYWIIENSWGSKWGEKGYMRLKSNGTLKRGACGIAEEPTFPSFYPHDPDQMNAFL